VKSRSRDAGTARVELQTACLRDRCSAAHAGPGAAPGARAWRRLRPGTGLGGQVGFPLRREGVPQPAPTWSRRRAFGSPVRPRPRRTATLAPVSRCPFSAGTALCQRARCARRYGFPDACTQCGTRRRRLRTRSPRARLCALVTAARAPHASGSRVGGFRAQPRRPARCRWGPTVARLADGTHSQPTGSGRRRIPVGDAIFRPSAGHHTATFRRSRTSRPPPALHTARADVSDAHANRRASPLHSRLRRLPNGRQNVDALGDCHGVCHVRLALSPRRLPVSATAHVRALRHERSIRHHVGEAASPGRPAVASISVRRYAYWGAVGAGPGTPPAIRMLRRAAREGGRGSARVAVQAPRPSGPRSAGGPERQ
jgi:hypothetical protein